MSAKLAEVTASLWGSAATFRRGTAGKLSYLFLNQLDLALTVLGASLGYYEMNPLVRVLLTVPWLMLVFKTAIPLFIAWIAPGRLLLPATVLLCFVVAWDVKELIAALL